MPTPPDLVLRGGHVWTGDPDGPKADAVAVRGGRILAVGTARQIEDLAGLGTRTIDLRGRMVMPGFQDAHVHPIEAGMTRLRCDLHRAADRDGCLAAVSAYAAAHPDAAWIDGDGWSMADFPGGSPVRGDLDSIVPERPVFLASRDGHSGWANSRALALAGIGRDTPDPADGRIEREPDGTPSGTLHEGAMEAVARLIPAPSPSEREEALRFAQGYLHRLGITAWHDASVTAGDIETYRALADRGELTARVVGAVAWDHRRGEEQIPELLKQIAGGAAGRFRPAAVKVWQDGVMENFTAGLVQPYLDGAGRSTGACGMSMVDPALLASATIRLDAAGVQVHVHAIGDRAVREALDAVAAARERNGWTDTRPQIAHIQLIHPDDIPRFSRLGVAANAQAYWACHEPQMDDLTIPFLGPERAALQYPFRSLLRAGAMLAMGSDWSVSTADPLRQIEVATTRVSDEARDRPPFVPHERLELAQALAAFTAGSAWANHLDAVTGRIRPGMLADLAVLDRDLFATDAGPAGDARVLATFVEGVAVFEDPALEG
jgi:predicted amidohydrolase YtcJ